MLSEPSGLPSLRLLESWFDTDAESLAQGRAQPLEAVVRAVVEVVAGVRLHFEEELALLGASEQAAVERETQEVGQRGAVTLRVAEDVRRATSGADSRRVATLVEQLGGTLGAWRQALEYWRGAAWRVVGPTFLPGVNLAGRLLQRLTEGETQVRGGLEAVLADERTALWAALGAAEAHGTAAGDEARREALEHLLAALQGMEQGSGWDAVVQAAADLERAHVRVLLSGPTAFTPMNHFIQALQAVLDGRACVEDLVDVAQGLVRDLSRLAGEAEALAGQAGTGERACRAATSLHEALAHVEQRVLRAVEDPSCAVADLEACSAVLEESLQELLLAASTEGRVPCVRCSHFSAVGRSVCELCGALLPRSVDCPGRLFEFREVAGDHGS